MANVRVDLKYFRNALDLLSSDISDLRSRAATPEAEAELASLDDTLTQIQTLAADACPDIYFRTFDVTEPGAARGMATKATRKKTARRKAGKKAR